MFDRLKHSLVESYVGALALGWLFAWAILDFVNIFCAPVTDWITRSEFRTMPGVPTGLLLRDSLPYLLNAIVLFLVAYILLRWLYFTPRIESSEPIADQEGLRQTPGA